MTYQEFKIQMDRMIQTFGKPSYNEERMKLIWQEVKDFEVSWFDLLCSKLIGENKFAPLIPEFRDACIDERERIHNSEKQKNARTAKEFMHRVFSDEDQSVLFKSLNNRITGKMNDTDFGQMLNSLDKLTKFEAPIPDCQKCDDTGMITFFDGKYENRRACNCK